MENPTQPANTKDSIPISKNLYSITNRDKTNNEIVVRTSSVLIRKINLDNTYDYVNHQLSTLSGYEDYELIGETYKKLIHTDMPNVLYSMLHERLNKGLAMHIIEKFETKNGSYFWLLSKYESKIDKQGSISFHTVTSTQVSKQTVTLVNYLYNSLKKIEQKTNDNTMSKRYLIGFLDNYKHTYNSFIEEIITNLSKNEFKKELETSIQKRVLKSNVYLKKKRTSTLFSQTNIPKKEFQLRKKGA